MMVVTAKVNLKKILIILGAIAVLIVGCILIFGEKSEDPPTAATNVSDNDSRIAFLQGFGWQVSTSPVSVSVNRMMSPTRIFCRFSSSKRSSTVFCPLLIIAKGAGFSLIRCTVFSLVRQACSS